MEDTLASLFSDTSRLMRRYFDERARQIGVTRPQWQVLTMLRRHEGINQGGLAEILVVEPITLCRMVDRLQEAELVERRRDPNDRRAWQLFLTDRARQLLTDLKPVGEELVQKAFAGLDANELEQLRRALSCVRDNLTR
ncbi:MarR family winged helix-turn-helix transcriptional regulator [Pseudomaricurvus sp. HS19]|uniref:MarR family winged helix-turn-helix transcriptional regulator n=1 Tax=Pseudomaricurvus sp. HS19 TaxID=2692626 RepID=UPI00136C900E|nr:MarR family transcriptional regulator [Pseudomaricurvus sp. HS19]MYM63543.1 MarR family transcriptional regulator [Pseudomaricurvus sp. HS19]